MARIVNTRLIVPVITMSSRNLVGAVPGAAINVGRVIEKHVDAGPLLQHGQADADQDDMAQRPTEKITPRRGTHGCLIG
jgi:hypothetical protein